MAQCPIQQEGKITISHFLENFWSEKSTIGTMQRDLNHIRNTYIYSWDLLESEMILDLVHGP